MGTYTTPYNLFKPDPSDAVDVDTNLNRNLDILDAKMKGIFNYLNTDVGSIFSDPNIEKGNKTKYYKTISNATAFWSAGGIYQDPNAQVYVNFTLPMLNGWQNAANSQSIPVYQVEYDGSNVARRVKLQGTIRLNNYDPIAPGTSYIVAQLPSSIYTLMTTDKYFVGNANQNNSITKIQVVASNGNVIITRYGNTQGAGLTSNTISLAYLDFPLGV